MSIEYRAMLRKDMHFQSGSHLDNGTVIYVEETPHGWVAKHFDNPKSGGGTVFQLELEDFSIFENNEGVREIVVSPDPETDEETEARAEIARKRIKSRIKTHREEANRLENFLRHELGT